MYPNVMPRSPAVGDVHTRSGAQVIEPSGGSTPQPLQHQFSRSATESASVGPRVVVPSAEFLVNAYQANHAGFS